MVTTSPTSKYQNLEIAARSGNLEQLKTFPPKYMCSMAPDRQKELCALAAGSGNLDCLRSLVSPHASSCLLNNSSSANAYHLLIPGGFKGVALSCLEQSLLRSDRVNPCKFNGT